MASKIIVLDALSEEGVKFALLSSPHTSPMVAEFFGECSRLPPLHSGCSNGLPINSPALQRSITPNFFETRPSEQLTCTRHVLYVSKPVIIPYTGFNKWRPRHTEMVVLSELLKQETKVVGFERDVRVKIPNDVVIPQIRPRQASVEGVYLRSKMPVGSLGHPHEL